MPTLLTFLLCLYHSKLIKASLRLAYTSKESKVSFLSELTVAQTVYMVTDNFMIDAMNDMKLQYMMYDAWWLLFKSAEL